MGSFSVKNLGIIVLSAYAIALLAGCATAEKPALVKASTSVRPSAADGQPANVGSLFPASGAAAGRFRPLFEDPRARNVGDTLTVVLNEKTAAKRSSSAAAEKSTELDIKADLSPLNNISGAVNGLPGSGIARNAVKRAAAAGSAFNGISAAGSNTFEGSGEAAAQNDFTGTITVTVIEVLSNGNLVIAGEKQLAVSAEEEVIRISGVVNPADLVRNSTTSSKIADLRLEYRGRGFGDDATRPGWFTGMLLKLTPF
jgi:flagellar L-ring protein precursor FlgH